MSQPATRGSRDVTPKLITLDAMKENSISAIMRGIRPAPGSVGRVPMVSACEIGLTRSILSLGTKATIIGLLTVGGPELLGLVAVLCLGKENLIYLKKKILAWLKRLKPAAPVSRNGGQIIAFPADLSLLGRFQP